MATTPVKKSVNVAILGLGSMGTVLARNLAFKGRSSLYLQLYSRSMEKAKALANTIWQDGAQCSMRVHSKPETLARWSDVIICTLPHAHACRDVYCDEDLGLFRHLRPGTIIVDHTTLDYQSTMEFRERVAQVPNAHYIDAPISGNVTAAKNGALTIMAGGEDVAYQKVLPLLRLYAEAIHLMGDSGTGTLSKLICQQLVAIHSLAAAEAMTMAHQLGIENHTKLLAVLDASWGSSTMLRRNAPLMERILRNPQELPRESRNTLRALVGDLDRVREVNPRLPLTSLTHDIFRRADEAGGSLLDFASIVNYLDTVEYVPSDSAAGSRTSQAMGIARPVSTDGDVMTVPSGNAAKAKGGKKKRIKRRKSSNPTLVSALAIQRAKEEAKDPNAVEAY